MNQKQLYQLPPWFYLSSEALHKLERNLLRFARSFRLSHSQIEQLCKMAKDLSDWGEVSSLKEFLRTQAESLRSCDWDNPQPNKRNPQQRKQAMADLASFYQSKQQLLPNFQRSVPKPKVPKYRFEVLEQKGQILGSCPVASVKTRCCNLLTLDAIQQCGFGCSYCAIQHFYDDKAIQFRGDFSQKLEQLELDPEKYYHIGTGQSSDSLLWIEGSGVLEPLLNFARKYPRAILEFKSKSANIKTFLQKDLAPNMLFTWSLNPDSFIRHEEALTAPLDARLRAARQMADRGAKVGFHFHPIVRYQGWKTEYRELAQRVGELFDSNEVVTISLGTLTFSKSALKTIRQKAEQTQILRFAMEEIAGKFSYSYQAKKQMFSLVYQALQPWHQKVFFYLCMEDPALWPDVFGYQYPNNHAFEQDMLTSYADKMGLT